MASQVRFKSGSTTVTFDGTTDGAVVEYNPKIPTSHVVSVQRATEDGASRSATAYRDVEEIMSLMISGTLSSMQTTTRKLNSMLQRARRVQTPGDVAEEPVYVEVTLDGGTSWEWRSEIVEVEASVLEDRALDLYLGQGELVFDLEFKRKPYWEYYQEVSIGLYHPGQSKTTSGITIYNCYDGYSSLRYDFVDIDNSDITGDLEAPVRFKMQNTFNDSDRLYHIYVHNNFKISPTANMDHIIESESGTGGTQQPGTINYSLYSSGYYMSASWSGTSENILCRWTFGSSFISECSGRYFQILMRIVNLPTVDSWLWVAMQYSVTTIWTGPKTMISSWTDPKFFVDLGTVRIPPFPVGRQATTYGIDLVLFGVNYNNSGTKTLDHDYLKLAPMDRWKFVRCTGYGTSYLNNVIQDDIDLLTYQDISGSRTPNYVGIPSDRTLFVTPMPETSGKQRFVFSCEGHDTDPQRTLKVYAYYRPRKLTI